LLRERDLDYSLVEEAITFSVGDGMSASKGAKQHCLSVERPTLTLADVVNGMMKNEDCLNIPEVRHRYMDKVFDVLRVVAKSLWHLHELGIVHGDLRLETCCKYGNRWKLSGILQMLTDRKPLTKDRLSSPISPECIELSKSAGKRIEVEIRRQAEAHWAMDCWAFGALAYNVLVGDPLFDLSKNNEHRNKALMEVLRWSGSDLEKVEQRLKQAGVLDYGIDLIVQCLSPHPADRPNMLEILDHPIWEELKNGDEARWEI
jgi:serine/threonine protein kinase